MPPTFILHCSEYSAQGCLLYDRQATWWSLQISSILLRPCPRLPNETLWMCWPVPLLLLCSFIAMHPRICSRLCVFLLLSAVLPKVWMLRSASSLPGLGQGAAKSAHSFSSHGEKVILLIASFPIPTHSIFINTWNSLLYYFNII
jgi:hypothetical protein